MKKMKRKPKGLLLLSILVSMMILGTLDSVKGAESSYQNPLVKGTEFYEVARYDAENWKILYNRSIRPQTFFKGETNLTGARAKVTTRVWYETDNGTTYDLFNTLLIPLEVQALLHSQGDVFNYTSGIINENYSRRYDIWWGYASRWNFTDKEFGADPDESNKDLIIFKDPRSFKYLLDDYHEWYDNHSKNLAPLLNFYGYSLPRLTANEFLWLMLNSSKIGIPNPVGDYLKGMINALNVHSVKVEGSTLMIERAVSGHENYTAMWKYGKRGLLYSFKIRDDYGRDLLKVVSTGNSTKPMVPILILVAVALVGLIGLAIGGKIWIKRKREKEIQEKTRKMK